MLVQFIAGAGLGLLIGILTGLSMSPVVAALLGVITTAAMLFIGLKESPKPELDSRATSRSKVALWRIIGFCFAAVPGVLSGVYLKAQDSFKETPRQQIQELTNAGFSLEEAKWVVWYQLARPPATPVTSAPEDSSQTAKSSTFGSFHVPTGLYGKSLGRSPDYDGLEPKRYLTSTNAIAAYQVEGGEWKIAADLVQKYMPEGQRMAALNCFWEFLRAKTPEQ